ncbi:MAG TPA: DUF4384 domain-containing protein, partial [Polyangiaceae bacterium]
MNSCSLWLVSLPLCVACAAAQSSPAPAPAPAPVPPMAANTPQHDATSEAAAVPEAAATDRELATRGLKRIDERTNIAPPNWSETRASMYILAHTRQGQVALVGSGAQLHTGEKIELHVSVGRPAFVYLIQISPTDQATILYPVEGESERMVPGIDYRM